MSIPSYAPFKYELSAAGVTPPISVAAPAFPLNATTVNLAVALINGTNDATATGSIQGLLDTADNVWYTIATFSLSISAGADPIADLQAIVTPYLDYRVKLSTITGTGSRVKFIAIVKKLS